MSILLFIACHHADTDPAETDPGDTDLPEAPWTWCAGADAFVGPEGSASFLSDDTPYCSLASEQRELADEVGAKAQIRFASGSFSLPDVEGTVPYRLPACTRLAGDAHLDLAGEGTVTTTVGSDGTSSIYTWHITQPLVDAAGDPWVLEVYAAQSADGAPEPVRLDGGMGNPFSTPSLSISVSRPDDFADYRAFGSCTMDAYPTDHHTVVFDGGQATFDLRIGESIASTEPAVYVRAQGTLDGVPFDVTDWWRLPYNPEHHHFSRHFGVLFDAPIGDACGLVARELDPWNEDPPGEIAVTSCDLSPLETRTVTSETWTR